MSSTLATGTSLMATGTAGGREDVVVPFRTAADATAGGTATAATVLVFTETVLANVETADRLGEVTTGVVLPPTPTVVHAPPTCGGTAV